MTKTVLDCQNLQCPQPVIQIKRLLDATSPGEVTVLVDNEAALENVSRFFASRGYGVEVSQEHGLWRIIGRARENAVAARREEPGAAPVGREADERGILVMILSPVFGSGDAELGGRLMKNFLATLPELGGSLQRIVMLGDGVPLATEGSPVIEELRRLELSGVSVLVCGACLEHFGLLGKKAVGQTTNMLDIVAGIQLADKILRI